MRARPRRRPHGPADAERRDGERGFLLAVLGPDGSGKSTVLEGLGRRLAPRFREIRRYHLRPHVGRSRRERVPVVDPHGRPPRGPVVSAVKLGWWWLDYWLGYLLVIRPALRRSTLVLFDRYFDDIVVDPARYRYGASARLARAVGSRVPRPDTLVVLDAPVEVLRSRKREVAPMETERQREAYLQLAAGLDSARVVDASRSIEAVVDEVARIVTGADPGGRP